MNRDRDFTRLFLMGAELGKLLSECKALVESGKEREVPLSTIEKVKELYADFDKECKAIGFKGGAEEFSERLFIDEGKN